MPKGDTIQNCADLAALTLAAASPKYPGIAPFRPLRQLGWPESSVRRKDGFAPAVPAPTPAAAVPKLFSRFHWRVAPAVSLFWRIPPPTRANGPVLAGPL